MAGVAIELTLDEIARRQDGTTVLRFALPPGVERGYLEFEIGEDETVWRPGLRYRFKADEWIAMRPRTSRRSPP